MPRSLFSHVRHYFFLALLGLTFAACLPAAEIPEAEDLHGAWESTDATTHRIMVFAAADDERPELAGRTNVYRIYTAPVGSDPILAQTGEYGVEVRLLNVGNDQVETEALVTRVLWDSQGLYTGGEYGNPIVDYDGATFTIGGVSSETGERTYEATDFGL